MKRFLRVAVPFRMRSLTGWVTEIKAEGEHGIGLKDVLAVSDLFPLVDGTMERLTYWASQYYITPLGLVLKHALPSGHEIEKYLSAQMDSCSGEPPMAMKKALASLGREKVISLRNAGSLRMYNTFDGSPFEPLPPTRESMRSDTPGNTLFLGGIESRLEYYSSLIRDRLAKNENILMLLPDYHQTGNYFSRAFLEKFPGKVLWYSSAVKAKTRMETYFKAQSGGGYLILGTRNCVFLSICDLGLVIVEHQEEDFYRNEENFRFNASTVAIERARLVGVSAVVGTASPSTEIWREAEEGRVSVVEKGLPTNRGFTESILEKNIAVYDGLPKELTETIAARIRESRRIALYTPRKDYASYIRCLECKTLFSCPVCHAAFSYRKSTNSLVCAACGRKSPYEEKCGQCGSELIRFSSIGAEYLEEHVRRLFPHVPVARITGETPKKELDLLKKIPADSPLVIAGTQALANMYGFTVNTLILLGWEELSRISGYRAHEKMFHILIHLIDALNPEEVRFFMERKRRADPSLFLDVREFCREELARRKAADFPPYARFFLVDVKKKNEKTGLKTVNGIKNMLAEIGYTGGIIGPLFQKRERLHWRMILSGNGDPLYRLLMGLYNIPDVRIEADPLYL
jgi:primosomal protein N' (replication factor Y)